MSNPEVVLNEKDVEYSHTIKDRLRIKDDRAVFSVALMLTAWLTNYIDKGDDLILKKKNGDKFKLDLPGITRAV